MAPTRTRGQPHAQLLSVSQPGHWGPAPPEHPRRVGLQARLGWGHSSGAPVSGWLSHGTEPAHHTAAPLQPAEWLQSSRAWLTLLWASCSPGAREHCPGATEHSPGAMDGISGTRPIPGGWLCPCLSSTWRLQGRCGLPGSHLCCRSLEILFKCHHSLPMSCGVAAPGPAPRGEMVDVRPLNAACRGTSPIGTLLAEGTAQGCTPHQEPEGMMMGMGTGEQGPIPEMAPGCKVSLCGSITSLALVPSPCTDPEHHLLQPHCCVHPPKPQSHPWVSSCTNLQAPQMPPPAQGQPGLTLEHPRAASTNPQSTTRAQTPQTRQEHSSCTLDGNAGPTGTMRTLTPHLQAPSPFTAGTPTPHA